jgi:hypothetical protein
VSEGTVSDESSAVGKLLKSVGIGSTGLEKIQFGPGVVGKMTTSLMGLHLVCIFAVIAGISLRSLLLVLSGLGVAFLAFLFKSVSSMVYAAKNPNLISYHAVEMAAKGLSVPDAQPNVEPRLIEPAGTDAEAVQFEHTLGKNGNKPAES